jgi:hypothetical protein
MKNKFNRKRPMSWSQMSLWNFDKEQWYRKYVLNEAQETSREMEFGKMIGEKLASDPTFLPDVPRLDKYEHKLEVVFKQIPLIGYMDGFCTKTNSKMIEFKTGKKAWDQKRVDGHKQLDMYLLMHYITTQINPEKMDVRLVWLPTQDNGDFSISFVEPLRPQIFTTKRTMLDILRFGQEIINTWDDMQEYVDNYHLHK